MLYLHCPYCDEMKDETELVSGGEAHIKRHGPGSSDEEFEKYLFVRDNPYGVHYERWRCSAGCGKWFHVARCTVSMKVYGSYPAQTLEPDAEILKKVASGR